MSSNMKTRLFTLACALTAFCACTKIEYREREVIEYIPVEPVTSYWFDGTEYSVHTLDSRYEDGYYFFFIARNPQAPYTSRIEVIIPEYNVGKILDFSDYMLTKGIDYVLLFEDQDHYYSPTYAPKSGTLQVRKNTEKDSYKLKFDILLHDGTPLKFEYNGIFK